jgi:hypothetical protein
MAFEEAVMNDKTDGNRAARRVCAGIGRAAACILLAVAVWRGERDGGPR